MTLRAELAIAVLIPSQIVAAQTLSDAAIRARADAPIARMTPEEKAGQLIKINGLAIGGQGLVNDIKAGHVSSIAYVTNPKAVNTYQKYAVDESRLKIPMLFAMDVIHGHRTILPAPIALAASWDPAVAESAQRVAAREARAAGLTWVFAPMIDIARDPRWGRIVEGAGEDPYLGAVMAGLSGRRDRRARPRDRRPQAFRRLRRFSRRAGLRRGQSLR